MVGSASPWDVTTLFSRPACEMPSPNKRLRVISSQFAYSEQVLYILLTLFHWVYSLLLYIHVSIFIARSEPSVNSACARTTFCPSDMSQV